MSILDRHATDSQSIHNCGGTILTGDIVNAAMNMIRSYKDSIIESGHEFQIDVSSCRWAVEQAILNRDPEITPLAAATEYVRSVEYRVKQFNGIETESEH